MRLQRQNRVTCLPSSGSPLAVRSVHSKYMVSCLGFDREWGQTDGRASWAVRLGEAWSEHICFIMWETGNPYSAMYFINFFERGLSGTYSVYIFFTFSLFLQCIFFKGRQFLK